MLILVVLLEEWKRRKNNEEKRLLIQSLNETQFQIEKIMMILKLMIRLMRHKLMKIIFKTLLFSKMKKQLTLAIVGVLF